MKRVVITGAGTINALGANVDTTLEAMREGRCGIGELEFRDVERLSIRIGGQVKGYEPEDVFNRQQLALYDRFTQFTLIAAREAITQSGLEFSGDLAARAGVVLGNSGGGVLTTYVAALDDRIQVAVPSCSLTGYTSSTGFVFHCDCCLVPRAPVELGDLSEIAGLVAPRPLLAVHGRQDTLHSVKEVERALRRTRAIYAAAGVAEHFELRWGTRGHQFYPKLMWPFIERHLHPAKAN